MGEAGMNDSDKVRENRMRRIAKRRGYVLTRCRYRDPRAIGYGGYILADIQNRAVLGTSPHEYSATLDDVEEFFTEMDKEQRREDRQQRAEEARLRSAAGRRQAVAIARKTTIAEKAGARRQEQVERRTERRFERAMRGRVAKRRNG